tara:strand:- start:974 stop:1387 length:414 start_codon:yes stop_codon:yes gene_type:complete
MEFLPNSDDDHDVIKNEQQIKLTKNQKELILNTDNMKIINTLLKFMKKYKITINEIENLIKSYTEKIEKQKEKKLIKIKEKETNISENKVNKNTNINKIINVNSYISDDELKSENNKILKSKKNKISIKKSRRRSKK